MDANVAPDGRDEDLDQVPAGDAWFGYHGRMAARREEALQSTFPLAHLTCTKKGAAILGTGPIWGLWPERGRVSPKMTDPVMAHRTTAHRTTAHTTTEQVGYSSLGAEEQCKVKSFDDLFGSVWSQERQR